MMPLPLSPKSAGSSSSGCTSKAFSPHFLHTTTSLVKILSRNWNLALECEIRNCHFEGIFFKYSQQSFNGLLTHLFGGAKYNSKLLSGWTKTTTSKRLNEHSCATLIPATFHNNFRYHVRAYDMAPFPCASRYFCEAVDINVASGTAVFSHGSPCGWSGVWQYKDCLACIVLSKE